MFKSVKVGILVFLAFLACGFGKVSAEPKPVVNGPVAQINTPYTEEVKNKLTSRCDLIKDYLGNTVRINELAARQNKVRGWEYFLRSLEGLKTSYESFEVDYSDLEKKILSLRRQLDQFKTDFEAYDSQFQRLLSIDCKSNPEDFWNALNATRSFRSGVSLSSENYKLNLSSVMGSEIPKW